MCAAKNRKKKIGVIGIKGLPAFGGAATVAENLYAHLKDEFDITVYAISSHTSDESKALEKIRTVIFRRFPVKTLNTFVYYLKSLFHALFVAKYDLIHLHHQSSGFITPLLRTRYKVLLTLHGIYRKDERDTKFGLFTGIFLKWTQWLNLKWSTIAISVSKADADYVIKEYGTPVLYIPNGVNVSALPAPVSFHADDEKPFVFAAGRIYHIKGLHVVLKAFHISGLNNKLKVIGNLDQVSAYRDEILGLSANLNIDFVPLIKNKNELFETISACRFFIFPSLVEAMSMMLLEVASLGVPLIASDIEANRAVFSDSEVLFFKSGDAEDLAKKLTFAFGNEHEMRARAEAARQKVFSQFTWPVISRQYETVIKEMLNDKHNA